MHALGMPVQLAMSLCKETQICYFVIYTETIIVNFKNMHFEALKKLLCK